MRRGLALHLGVGFVALDAIERAGLVELVVRRHFVAVRGEPVDGTVGLALGRRAVRPHEDRRLVGLESLARTDAVVLIDGLRHLREGRTGDEELAEALASRHLHRGRGRRGARCVFEDVVVERAGADGRLGNLVVLAVVGDALLGERELQDVPALLEAGARLLARDAEGLVLDASHAAPNAERVAAAVEHVVEHRDLVREADGVMPGQDAHARAHVDALGPPRPVGEALR